MNEKYLEIRLPGCVVFLTVTELLQLLSKDPELYGQVLQRGKAFKRAKEIKRRQVEHIGKHYKGEIT